MQHTVIYMYINNVYFNQVNIQKDVYIKTEVFNKFKYNSVVMILKEKGCVNPKGIKYSKICLY